MTTAALQREASRASTWIGGASAVGGSLILLARPWIARSFGWTTTVVVLVFLSVLALGLAAPAVGSSVRPGVRTWLAALGAGAGVFVVGRVLSSGHAPYRATFFVIGLNTLAAFAEEALFRRALFAALLPAGPIFAIGGSALLFGVAHATVYGWWAVPLDVGAGLLLGWQRWVTGSWVLPAFTHAFADLLVVI